MLFHLAFPPEVEIPPVDVLFIHPRDRYGLLFPDIEDLQPLKIPLQSGTAVSMQYNKIILNYLPSKRSCKDDYIEGHSALKLEKIVLQ